MAAPSSLRAWPGTVPWELVEAKYRSGRLEIYKLMQRLAGRIRVSKVGGQGGASFIEPWPQRTERDDGRCGSQPFLEVPSDLDLPTPVGDLLDQRLLPLEREEDQTPPPARNAREIGRRCPCRRGAR